MVFNLLDKAYKKIWVPFFGRGLYLFVSFIEGKTPDKKPTYKIDESERASKKN
ncbi:hypothetical protein EV11_1518 [Prochlorococcus sp. SS52]|uniref:hypothetical protein n=1 Tax=Prochlorococcus marinus TaxID=1219 RepID=UPI0002DBC0F8|nr:hypothetical protein [Prochlorococcus marinus]KGG11698.1 hypothetical protein EV04_0722 [Prochlorococcus marinus str. LG]KGG18890.1 hypothetical protein EV08_1377 [Prochlorococcus marinus str. SS2]KGG23572.1 hypothetical protein EV09_1196 [Prochlorococcus marinus str. SS35]KGG35116.1 hypothetical protein EV11_1518 [Prochlorococcus sp. SS52]KGG32192.1 hypothetical protein EV10_1307 [Prochlorococcus marinus str. SS51]